VTPELSEAHTNLIAESAITDEVRDARGYRTEVSLSELGRLGFAKAQRLPGLLIPIHDVHGEIRTHQLRPDDPRTVRDRLTKYETPKESKAALDVHPFCREQLGDPTVPLFITEGIRKGDAIVSAGASALALLGVWNWRGTNSLGGKIALPDFEAIALNNREVFIVFDSDAVQKELVRMAAYRLGKFLERRDGNVKLVELPNGRDGQKVGVDDFLAAGNSIDDLKSLVVERFSVAPELGKSGKVQILRSGQLREQVKTSIETLAKENDPPRIFVRGGKMVRIRTDEKGNAGIEQLGESALRHELNQAADFFKVTQTGIRDETPPLDVVRDILSTPPIGDLFPALSAITSTPSIRPDGSISDRPGFDAKTGVYYHDAGGLNVPAIPDNPADADIERARSTLDDVLCDFPWADDASKPNAVATLLTPVIRTAIDGNSPLALLHAPQSGSGKGLLTDLVAIIATGLPGETMTAPRTDDEWRKQITAALVQGGEIIKIDNVTRELNSGVLAAALTSTIWKERVLGKNTESVLIPQKATWIANGNNLRLGGDMARRCYWIRLDPRMARPWERNDFRHPDLLEVARQRRGELIWALLVLARAWWQAGRPTAGTRILGSFENWSRIVGGVVTHAGYEGFLGNLDSLYDRADEETEEWSIFLGHWMDTFGSQQVTVGDLFSRLIVDNGPFEGAIPVVIADAIDGKPGAAKIRIGKALKARDRRHYRKDGLRVERLNDDATRKVGTWRVTTDLPWDHVD